MGYLCNVESAIAVCDSYNFDTKKKRKKKTEHYHSSSTLRRFTYPELESATNGFSPRNLLGKGSHASVFRAVLDNGAVTVAVKKTIASVTATAENEIHILSEIYSRRIVNLIGYTVYYDIRAVPSQRKPLLLVVVEYMPNGSLYDVIHKNPKPLGWSNRVRFALQVSKAVQALHNSNPPVLHRDIKSSNVLMDERGNARLSDFGLALRCNVDDTRVLSTPPAGTLGYLDPGYLAPGDVSTKRDVFSFGILLLEIISGRRAIDVGYSPPSIIEWALPLIKSGDYQGICDRRIRSQPDPTVRMELGILAAKCVRSTAEKRPTMAEVSKCLEIVYKRVKGAGPIWSNLRRRVRHVERSLPLDSDGFEGSDLEEQVVRTCRRTLSGRSRKVSSVASPPNWITRIDQEMIRGSHRVGRSKSVGSFREINSNKKMAQVTVKLSGLRLSKSRSTSVLNSRSNNNNNNNNNKGFEEQMKQLQIKEMDEFPLLVNFSINRSTSHDK